MKGAKATPAALEAARQVLLRNIVYQTPRASDRFRMTMQAISLGLSPGYLEAIQRAAAAMTPADYGRIIQEQINLDSAIVVLAGDERDYRSPPETAGFPVVRVSAAPPPEPPAEVTSDAASREEAIRLLAEVKKAMGGEEALAAIHDATWDYEAKLTRVSPPVIVTQHNSWLSPGFYRQEQTSSVGSGISYYDGSVGWMATGNNVRTLAPLQSLQYRNEVIRLLFKLVRAGELEGYKADYLGSGVVKITSAEGYRVELAIDFQTKLPERLRFAEIRGNDGLSVQVEEQLSDYRRVNGVPMPHRVLVKQAGVEYADFTMKQLQFNTGLTAEEISKRP